MKVAFCASEVFPFAKTGGLADVAGALPLALQHFGVESMIFMPRYQCVSKQRFNIKPVTETISKTTLPQGIDVYFVESDEYFNRDGLYVGAYGDYPDNLDRFQFFCLKVLEFLRDSSLEVDVIHCHDWQTALIPVFLKEQFFSDRKLSQVKTLLTLHNLAFQGVFPKAEFAKLGLSPRLLTDDVFGFHGKINLLKAGIVIADKVSTVSATYAKEILTKEFGCGLEEVLKRKRNGISGIINGLDYEVWDPSTDTDLAKTYDAHGFAAAKAFNKMTLQKKFGLKQDDETPVFGFVGRLSHQKGVDLVLDSMDDMSKMGAQVIIQGVGEGKYRDALLAKSRRCPENLAIHTDFDEKTAHLVYGGSDFFLMPSTFEPCGLSQMISLRYGTAPIVYRTGGLADTVAAFNPVQQKGNGFVFIEYSVSAFLNEVRKAVAIFKDKKNMRRLIENAFKSDFRWDNSATEYIEVYQCLSSV